MKDSAIELREKWLEQIIEDFHHGFKITRTFIFRILVHALLYKDFKQGTKKYLLFKLSKFNFKLQLEQIFSVMSTFDQDIIYTHKIGLIALDDTRVW